MPILQYQNTVMRPQKHPQFGKRLLDIDDRLELEFLIESINPRICDLEELPDRTPDEDAELLKLRAEKDDAERQLSADV
jgi:hypothetical protein